MPPGSMYCNPFGPRAYPFGVLRALTDVPGFRLLRHTGRSVAASAIPLDLMHRSAWKGYSANFALTEFSEVALVLACPHTSPVRQRGGGSHFSPSPHTRKDEGDEQDRSCRRFDGLGYAAGMHGGRADSRCHTNQGWRESLK